MSNKTAFTKEEFLAAVKKRMTTSASILASELGTTRQSIYNFYERHPEAKGEAEQILKGFDSVDYSIRMNSFEVFQNIPCVQNWVTMYRAKPKMVAESKILTRQRQLWYMCKHLKVHPMKVTPEQVAEVIVDARNKTFRKRVMIQKGQLKKGDPIPEELRIPKGLGYYGQRECWRSFMQMIRGVSGLQMSNLGVDAQASFGYGSQSTQRLTKEQRASFDVALKEVCRNPKFSLNYNHYLEGLAAAKLMYNTGTRRAACCNINFEYCKFEFNPDMWIIEVIDKGERGGIKWDKIFIGQALKELKDYISERFKITEDLETTVPKKVKALFPSYYEKENLMTATFRRAHDLAGIKTTIPVHIFRHTFAQDCLDATDWNYETVADLGGWKNTKVLKDAYGQKGRSPKIRALRKAQGLPVEDVTYELLW